MAAFHFGDPEFAVGDPVAVGYRESWGRAGCGTKIGGSLKSNVALKDVIQPFGRRRRPWLYREASVASAATRILSYSSHLVVVVEFCLSAP